MRLDTGLRFIDGNSIAFSPDGKLLVMNVIRKNSEGAETTEWVAWNLDTGAEQARLACPGLARTRFSFSRDGKLVAGIARFDDSGWGTWPRLWNITSGEEITPFPKFDYETLENVVLRPDGAVLAGIERSFSGETTIYEWSVGTAEELNQIERQTFEINQLRYDPDGGFLFGLGGLSIMAWESETDEPDLRLPGHESPVCDIAFHPSGRLRSVDEFGNVMQWDISDYYSPEPAAPGVVTVVDSVRAVDRQGFRAAYYEDVSKDGPELHRYDLKIVDRDGVVLVRKALSGRRHYINEKLQFSASGSLLAAITTNQDQADGVIHVWETASLAERYTQIYQGGADDVGTKVVDLDLHPAETHIAVLLHEPRSATVQIIDLTGKSTVRNVFTTPRNPGSWSVGECCRSGLAWSPDGASLTISVERLNESEGNWLRIVLIDATSGAVRWEWTGDIPATSSPAFSADGKHVAIGVDHAYDGNGPEMHVWDVNSGDRLYALKGHRHPVISVAFHPHEPRLVSASWHDGDEQGEVIVWDLTTGQPVARWNDLDNTQSDGVHFSRDGHRLLFSGHKQLPELSVASEFMIWDGTPVQQ